MGPIPILQESGLVQGPFWGHLQNNSPPLDIDPEDKEESSLHSIRTLYPVERGVVLREE